MSSLCPYAEAGLRPYAEAGLRPYAEAGLRPYAEAGLCPYAEASLRPYAEAGLRKTHHLTGEGNTNMVELLIFPQLFFRLLSKNNGKSFCRAA